MESEPSILGFVVFLITILGIIFGVILMGWFYFASVDYIADGESRLMPSFVTSRGIDKYFKSFCIFIWCCIGILIILAILYGVGYLFWEAYKDNPDALLN